MISWSAQPTYRQERQRQWVIIQQLRGETWDFFVAKQREIEQEREINRFGWIRSVKCEKNETQSLIRWSQKNSDLSVVSSYHQLRVAHETLSTHFKINGSVRNDIEWVRSGNSLCCVLSCVFRRLVTIPRAETNSRLHGECKHCECQLTNEIMATFPSTDVTQ